jgi:hypothetical protein
MGVKRGGGMLKCVAVLKKGGKTRRRYAENSGGPRKKVVDEDETGKTRIFRNIVGQR